MVTSLGFGLIDRCAISAPVLDGAARSPAAWGTRT
jgi:hypothetical protein